MKKLNVIMIYGEMASRGRGPYLMEDLYIRKGLTGSESSFFNLARALSARGHQVGVICDTPAPAQHPSGFAVMPLQTLPALRSVPADVVIAWNEPDYLEYAPPNALKICDQQLNDFGYVQNRNVLHQLADIWVAPSQNHLDYLTTREGLGIGGTRVIPNSVDLSLFQAVDARFRDADRNPKKVIWCSSPDRGLHHLLSFWPEIRARVPDAELHIFYRLAPWIADVGQHGAWTNTHPDVQESGRRARYVDEALRRMRDGFGIVVRDLVPNVEMARELCSAGVLAYTCDPIRYTEGFGVSALDAAAAGCHVLISDADALPSVHGEYAHVIQGRPDAQRKAWIDAIVGAMSSQDGRPTAPVRYSHDVVAEKWERLMHEQLHFRQLPVLSVTPPVFQQTELGQVVRPRQRLAPSGDEFFFWETSIHASWWSKEDEQNVRDRHWHPKTGDIVVDGGAAFGSYTLPALAAGARVIAFSPADPDTELLIANVDLNPKFAGRFMLSRDGLSDRDCWFDPARSAYVDQPEGVPGVLRCRALDAWLAEHSEIPRIDWIKLDVEGAELDALRGAEQCLRRWKPRLLIECHDFHRPMFEVVRDFVLGLGLGYTCEAHPHGGVSHAFFEVV